MDEKSLLIQQAPYLGIFLLLILGTLGFPFPEEGILILSGCLIAHNVMNPYSAAFVLYCGLLLTDVSLYWIGKKMGRRLIEHRRFGRILPPERLSTLERRFNKWGGWVLLLGRQVLGLRAQVLLGAGWMKMSRTKFFVMDSISALLTMTLWVGLGYAGGNSTQQIRREITRIEHMGILLLAALIIGGIVLIHLKSRRRRFLSQKCT